MAKSDFFKAKLPRQTQKMLALTGLKKDAHYNGRIRRMFIDAHAVHVKHKMDIMRGKDPDAAAAEKTATPEIE